MKRIATVLCSLLLLCGLASAKDKQVKIAQTELPAKAQEFVANHFAQSLVKKVVKSTADNGVEAFFVTFKDKTRIEFDMVGAWSVITAKKAAVSDVVAPVRIRSVLRTDFAGKTIKAADNDGLRFHFVFDDKSEVRINAFGEIME
ncbi:MAG: hypothetical protein J6Z12_07250 [Paludibacteraceae bacterium]|jgi:hypothetical protein|nr:hypothetical protein [Paludibacteraceae bacterium]